MKAASVTSWIVCGILAVIMCATLVPLLALFIMIIPYKITMAEIQSSEAEEDDIKEYK